jgi:hypothetical protein
MQAITARIVSQDGLQTPELSQMFRADFAGDWQSHGQSQLISNTRLSYS